MMHGMTGLKVGVVVALAGDTQAQQKMLRKMKSINRRHKGEPK